MQRATERSSSRARARGSSSTRGPPAAASARPTAARGTSQPRARQGAPPPPRHRGQLPGPPRAAPQKPSDVALWRLVVLAALAGYVAFVGYSMLASLDGLAAGGRSSVSGLSGQLFSRLGVASRLASGAVPEAEEEGGAASQPVAEVKGVSAAAATAGDVDTVEAHQPVVVQVQVAAAGEATAPIVMQEVQSSEAPPAPVQAEEERAPLALEPTPAAAPVAEEPASQAAAPAPVTEEVIASPPPAAPVEVPSQPVAAAEEAPPAPVAAAPAVVLEGAPASLAMLGSGRGAVSSWGTLGIDLRPFVLHPKFSKLCLGTVAHGAAGTTTTGATTTAGSASACVEAKTVLAVRAAQLAAAAAGNAASEGLHAPAFEVRGLGAAGGASATRYHVTATLVDVRGKTHKLSGWMTAAAAGGGAGAQPGSGGARGDETALTVLPLL